MVKTEERTIGDYTFRVTQLPVDKARKVFVRLVKTAGPALAKLIEGTEASPKKSLLDLQPHVISEAITRLAMDLREEDLEFVIDQVLGSKYVRYNSEGDAWPELTKEEANTIVFPGKLHDFFRLLGFALEVNFSGFLGVFGSAASSIGAAVAAAANQAKPSSSPQT